MDVFDWVFKIGATIAVGGNALAWTAATIALIVSNRGWKRAERIAGSVEALEPANRTASESDETRSPRTPQWVTVRYAHDGEIHILRSSLTMTGLRRGETVMLQVRSDGKARVESPWHVRWAWITSVAALISWAVLAEVWLGLLSRYALPIVEQISKLF